MSSRLFPGAAAGSRRTSDASGNKPQMTRRRSARGSRAVKINFIADWAIIKRLGSGASGAVHVAKHMQDNREAAIKIIDKHEFREEFGDDEEMMEACHLETQIMHTVKGHPNVIELIDVEDNDKYYCIIMPLAVKDLVSKMKEFYGKKDTLSAWRYGKDMLAGIQHIHTHGIIHNDIKLENCVVMPNGNLMLIDFGLSSYAKRRREDQVVEYCGTRQYMAPEILQQRDHGQEVDIWAFGVVLFHMLTGDFPFRDDKIGQLQADIATMRYAQPVFKLDNHLRRLFQKIFNPSTASRLTAEQLLQHEWFTTNPIPVEPKTDPPAATPAANSAATVASAAVAAGGTAAAAAAAAGGYSGKVSPDSMPERPPARAENRSSVTSPALDAEGGSPIPRVSPLTLSNTSSVDGSNDESASRSSSSALRLRVLPKVGSPTKSRPRGVQSPDLDGSNSGAVSDPDDELFSPPPSQPTFKRAGDGLSSAQVAINITSDSGDQTAALMAALAAAADAALNHGDGSPFARSSSPLGSDGGDNKVGSRSGSRNNSETRRSPRGSEILNPLNASGSGGGGGGGGGGSSALMNKWTPLEGIGKSSIDDAPHHLSVGASAGDGGVDASDAGGGAGAGAGAGAGTGAGAAVDGEETAEDALAPPLLRKRGTKKKKSGGKRLPNQSAKKAGPGPYASPSTVRKSSTKGTTKTSTMSMSRSQSETVGGAKKKKTLSRGVPSSRGVKPGAKIGGRRMRQSKTTLDKSSRPPRAPVPPPA